MIDNEILRSDKCEAIFSELSAYIDGELDENSVLRIEAHLEKCEKCRKLLSEFYALSEDIGAASIPYPEDLHTRLMKALDEEMSKGRKKSRVPNIGKAMKKHGMWLGAGVAAVICLALVGSPILKESFSFGTDAAKGIIVEDDIMPQNGGTELYCEMSRTGDADKVYYMADEAEKATVEMEYFSDGSLADNEEMLSAEKSEDMTEPDAVQVTVTKNEFEFSVEMKYELLPIFMLPRGELGWPKTELAH